MFMYLDKLLAVSLLGSGSSGSGLLDLGGGSGSLLLSGSGDGLLLLQLAQSLLLLGLAERLQVDLLATDDGRLGLVVQSNVDLDGSLGRIDVVVVRVDRVLNANHTFFRHRDF